MKSWMDEYFIQVDWELVTFLDGTPIGAWILINGERLSYLPLPGAFPSLTDCSLN